MALKIWCKALSMSSKGLWPFSLKLHCLANQKNLVLRNTYMQILAGQHCAYLEALLSPTITLALSRHCLIVHFFQTLLLVRWSISFPFISFNIDFYRQAHREEHLLRPSWLRELMMNSKSSSFQRLPIELRLARRESMSGSPGGGRQAHVSIHWTGPANPVGSVLA